MDKKFQQELDREFLTMRSSSTRDIVARLCSLVEDLVIKQKRTEAELDALWEAFRNINKGFYHNKKENNENIRRTSY